MKIPDLRNWIGQDVEQQCQVKCTIPEKTWYIPSGPESSLLAIIWLTDVSISSTSVPNTDKLKLWKNQKSYFTNVFLSSIEEKCL